MTAGTCRLGRWILLRIRVLRKDVSREQFDLVGTWRAFGAACGRYPKVVKDGLAVHVPVKLVDCESRATLHLIVSGLEATGIPRGNCLTLDECRHRVDVVAHRAATQLDGLNQRCPRTGEWVKDDHLACAWRTGHQ